MKLFVKTVKKPVNCVFVCEGEIQTDRKQERDTKHDCTDVLHLVISCFFVDRFLMTERDTDTETYVWLQKITFLKLPLCHTSCFPVRGQRSLVWD